MKPKYIVLLLGLIIPLLAPPKTNGMVQESDQEISETIPDQTLAESEGIEDSNVWDLVGQAGEIRYPIFAILVIGIFLISLKVFELYMDSKRSKSLRNTPFEDLNLQQINKTLARQTNHMLMHVMAKLVNVFQTNRNADYLHDEISNYNQFQQNNFNSFRNRIDFLSDTAGALGLLGTVWGMFMVFSTGTLEKENILAGMGLALMSTLLGLIVSIILNFSSTLTEGYFTKRLEKVTSKADELRFRLIELSENPATATETADFRSSGNHHASKSNEKPQLESPLKTSSYHKESESEVVIKPEKLLLISDLDKRYHAGDTISDIKVQLTGSDGKPVASEPLEIVLKYSGKIDGNSGKAVLKTDKNGTISFDWELCEKTGVQKAGIRCSAKEFNHIKTEIMVEVGAGEPKNLRIKNNHQAAETGATIPKPVILNIEDKFGNPVPDIPLLLEVTMGNGSFPDGSQKLTKKTNAEGKTEFNYQLGDEPGFNAVDIKVKGYEIKQKFQAVGQEVTV